MVFDGRQGIARVLAHVRVLAALRLGESERLYSPLWAWGGLTACLLLAFSIEPATWAAGVAILAAGLLWRGVAAVLGRRRAG